ncbi:MAG: GNAT family N-acetyltransferase [Sphingomonas sp.]|nr:MAG: GNAT family N-acetyltransferase [Sphingomonas sp.]
MTDTLRLATEADVRALSALIARSARELQAEFYSDALLDVAVGTAFGLDPMLLADGTYYLIERDGVPVACGGWSFRAKTYGGAGHLADATARMEPGRDAARIRAFFVHPDYARQGLGSRMLAACEQAARDAGFTHAEMVATLAGEKLYSRHGWVGDRPYNEILPGGVELPVIRMTKRLDSLDGIERPSGRGSGEI